MSAKLHFTLANVVISLFSFCCVAQDVSKDCDQSNNLTFTTHDIFELTEPETIFLHHWANFLHIKTKDKTLLNESAFFLEKCQVTEADLQELERHLRGKKYIRDAVVKFDEQKKVSVETWDNWSLLPTIEFGRKGGKNKFSLGILDRNLLGLGIDAEIEYFTNDQRSGYKFDSQFPLFLHHNINGSIRLIDSDDGRSQALSIQKKFVSFSTPNAYKIGFDNFDQIDTQYNHGEVFNRYRHKQYLSTVSWQWLHQQTAKDSLRFGIGFTQEQHNFFSLVEAQKVQTLVLPAAREFSYPFVSFEYQQNDFRELANMTLINHVEDFNLGWHASAQLGSDFSGKQGAPKLIWQSNLAKGMQVFDRAFLFVNAGLAGEFYDQSSHKDRYLFSLGAEYFHKINEQWTAYINNVSRLSKNQFLDAEIVLGGDTGLRGFPLHYQRGKHSTKFTFEARYYPQINLYKLLELGGAIFVDTGKVFGQSQTEPPYSSWMTSVGIGARFYSTRSSDSRVIHFDIIKPVTSDPKVNSIEFRLTTKQSF